MATGSQHGDPQLQRPTHLGLALWLPGINLLMCLKHQGSKRNFRRGHQVQPGPWMSSLIVNKYLSSWTPPGMWKSLTAHFISGKIWGCCLRRNSLYPWVQIVLYGPHGVNWMPNLLCYNSPVIIQQPEREIETWRWGGVREGRRERERQRETERERSFSFPN